MEFRNETIVAISTAIDNVVIRLLVVRADAHVAEYLENLLMQA